MGKISVCIPMYNENSVIKKTAQTLSEYMKNNFDDYEIIFSNDGSTDGCDKTVTALNLPNVRVIGDGINRGKGYAVRNAMLNATGDVRVFTDSDLAYGTEVIKSVSDVFVANKDVGMVVGSRTLNKDGYSEYSLLRKIASKCYFKVVCLYAGYKLSDSQCGCKGYSDKAAEDIFSRCEIDGFAFDLETVLWANRLDYKIVELPVKIINHGDSKVHIIKDTLRMLFDIRKIKRSIKRKCSG